MLLCPKASLSHVDYSRVPKALTSQHQACYDPAPSDLLSFVPAPPQNVARGGKGSLGHAVFQPLLGHRRMGLGPGTFPFQDVGSPHSLCGIAFPASDTRVLLCTITLTRQWPSGTPQRSAFQTPGKGEGHFVAAWNGGCSHTALVGTGWLRGPWDQTPGQGLDRSHAFHRILFVTPTWAFFPPQLSAVLAHFLMS